MERYVCIHGHFYQPPRENPWLESVELQDSAYPSHDWNERITAECYGPNAVARMLDTEGRISQIVNNYARISYNFGPTLLSWLEGNAPDVYEAVLAADRDSQQFFSGHGSALAQGYNHMIMPLANSRDKFTQVYWGIRDFERRFGRKPEGFWLPEAAVDLESLDVLAEHGIRFTILSPYQAARARPIGAEDWQDVEGGRIDPSTPYVQRLPSGRTIVIFFYDGPISRAVAFEKLLSNGERFAQRLMDAFDDSRTWPQLSHIATDGETYGHHSPHGDMALAFALHRIETTNGAKLTNYGEFLERHAPTHEVEIFENSSWSCVHGVERWRSNCGCNAGRSDWSQEWRKPLREALDWLRDALNPQYEKLAQTLLKDPWAARNEYISIVLDRSSDNLERFLGEQAVRILSDSERTIALKLLEMQRHLMLMYTSCGWFFDELSGIETVQVIHYAGRAVQLAQELFGDHLEESFLDLLAKAKSNFPDHRDGRRIYEKFVKPAMLSWEAVGAHYAVSSLFESFHQSAKVFCYSADREDLQSFEAGRARLVVGRVRLTSDIIRESELLSFGALHFGDHNVNCGVRKFQNEATYQTLTLELSQAFSTAHFPEIIRHFDKGFGESNYSLRSLFRDQQRKVMRQVLGPSLAQARSTLQRLYEEHLPSMRFLMDMGAPLPRAFRTEADFVINTDLRWAFEDDEPNIALITKLLDEAALFNIGLDTPGLAHRLRETLGRMASRLRDNPEDLKILQSLAAIVDLTPRLPFEVDLWQPQNLYFVVMRDALNQFENAAIQGDQTAQIWVEQFLDLGIKLGIQVADLKKKVARIKKVPTVAGAVEYLLGHPHVPRATYRLQFNQHFTFRDAESIVPYLHEIGVSDCYSSPILKAKPGSLHGYDIVDHSQPNPEIGGQNGLDSFTGVLSQRGMGLILDTVPNHMGIAHSSSRWWIDVLENGPSSVYASFFDIEWHPVNPDLENKVLLPILEDQYGAVLEAGKVQLVFDEGAFHLRYYDFTLPIGPRTYAQILEQILPRLTETVGENDAAVQELRSILTALSYLPQRTETASDRIAERNREKEVIKRRIAALVQSSPAVQQAISETVAVFNGRVGESRSFDLLDKLLESQGYRLAYWRVATEEINYRRFFDINELAAIATEIPEVFLATHEVILQLLAAGKASGLRIDHCDGLWDPAGYFLRLQEEFLVRRVRAILGPEHCSEGFEQEALARFAAHRERSDPAHTIWPLYVVAEKILGENEPLPHDWAIYGTTGYDFLNAANGIFVDQANADSFESTYSRFIDDRIDFTQLVVNCQKTIMLVSMASEVNALSHELDRISERNRRYRDFTLNSLTLGIREIIAAMFIYRTYITGDTPPSLRDRMFVEQAVEDAKDRNPGTVASVFDFIRDTILLRNVGDFAEDDRPRLIRWTMKFQQLTGPVLAKGLEDTAFYIYNRLVSLNEVGGHPERFGTSVADFHRHNHDTLQNWPHAVLTSATHDTKRGEDVRARLNVLSEMPEQWQAALGRWTDLNDAKKNAVDGRLAPSRNEEYLLYQTLIGAWPIEPMDSNGFQHFRDRILTYMQKATKEAKIHTSWINPDPDYDAAVHEFVMRLLPDDPDDPFVKDLTAFQRPVTFCGYFNSLAQVLLKLTSPGVPDMYQGTELWDLSLVDPDNRRPVDYERRRTMLDRIKLDLEQDDLALFLQDLLAEMPDGRIKMYLTYRVLNYRRSREEFFARCDYEPLHAAGEKQEHVCAFLRLMEDEMMVVVVPRLVYRLTEGGQSAPMGAKVWRDTRLVLPTEQCPTRFRNLLTGQTVRVESNEGSATISLAAILEQFPVALLEGRQETKRNSRDYTA